MSGVIPQVAALMGPCAAGTAYIPGLADFVPMVKGTSSMALGGRHLVKAAVGEDVTEDEMGGSGVHTKISGVADLDAWIEKLRDENVTFLEQEYKLGDTRAIMIEGPSREALELVETK